MINMDPTGILEHRMKRNQHTDIEIQIKQMEAKIREKRRENLAMYKDLTSH